MSDAHQPISSVAAAKAGGWRSVAEVLEISLDRIERLAQVAWRLYDERRHREAAAVFRGLLVLDPENIDLYRGHALAAAADQDLITAIEAVDQALLLLDGREEREADRGQLFALRAAYLQRAGRKREARVAAETSLANLPAAPWTDALRQGVAKMGQTQLAPADAREPSRQSLPELLEERILFAVAGHQSLAWALGYQDQDMFDVFQNGATLLDAGQVLRARRIFEGLIALEPRVPLFHAAVGVAWDAIGDLARADAAFAQAVEVASAVDDGVDLVADALLRRATHAARHGRQSDACSDLQQLLGFAADVVPEEVRARAQSLLEGLTRKVVPRERVADRL